ncbi:MULTISPECIES: hypothetical protein [Streptomyces]|uniref:ABC transporter permease n=2 Tax=Streptomyces TaxID=1883 RepID=A0A2U9P3K4_STRAS|nr:hypothetical protein [Streptomyces actuosus]AWT44072.1 hypothetical protein DMT42_18290 [Streptomyces actuosus]MBM4820780.1 hypothetical protein [Streptomyces actuosus]
MTTAVLRLHRTALLVWTAFVAALLLWQVWLNTAGADETRRLTARCRGMLDYCDAFSYGEQMAWPGILLSHTCLAVAAYAGGALIGRELESGTAHLAWTQGVTPARWLAAKLAVPAVAVTLGGTALMLAFRAGWAANRDLMWDDWWTSYVFVDRGPALVAYGLCALAVGTLLALLMRRTLAALGAGLAVMLLLTVTLDRFRSELWPTVTRRSARAFDPPEGAWQLDGGHRGGRYVLTYHPESHFWALHLVETGVLLGVAALCTAGAFAVLRRRVG